MMISYLCLLAESNRGPSAYVVMTIQGRRNTTMLKRLQEDTRAIFLDRRTFETGTRGARFI